MAEKEDPEFQPMFDVLKDILNRITRGGLKTDPRVRREMEKADQQEAEVRRMRAIQDEMAKIKRRN